MKTLMLFGNSEVHFWSYEGSENGKLKKLALKAITKRNALADTK